MGIDVAVRAKSERLISKMESYSAYISFGLEAKYFKNGSIEIDVLKYLMLVFEKIKDSFEV